MKDDDILKEAREAFELAAEREVENRAEALDDIRFARLAEQWPAQIRRQRELDGRPCLTVNKLPAFIRQVVNDARQNKPQIVCHPADSAADPQTADILNGLIRQIEASSKADHAYDTALECAVTLGFGWFRINTAYAEDDAFDLDLTIERIANPFSVWGDPHSTAADSSDWNLGFVTELMTKAAFEARYKGAEAVDWSSGAYAGLSSSWLDGDGVRVLFHDDARGGRRARRLDHAAREAGGTGQAGEQREHGQRTGLSGGRTHGGSFGAGGTGTLVNGWWTHGE